MDAAEKQKKPLGRLVVLMVTAFLDMVGVLIVVPLLPFYAKDLGAGGLVVGLLVSSFSIAQLLMAPVWGRFSDHYGRRPALMIGMTTSAIAFVVFAFANSLWLLFLMRLVQGAGGGTVSVIQAYVADAVEPNDRAKALGWLSAATNVGVAVGPVIGGLSLSWGRSAPGLLAAGMMFVTIAFAWRYLRESRDMTDAAAVRAQPKTGASRVAMLRVASHPAEPASRLIWIYAIAIGAFQGSTAILALFLAERFCVTANTIWIFFAYIGVISIVARAVMLGPLVDRLREARLSRIGLILLASGLGLISFMHPSYASPWLTYLPLALAVALLPLGTAFTFPCVTALLSRVVSSSERGLYMGVQQTFGGASRVGFPIVYGFLFDRVVEAPFLLGAALVVFTIFLGRGMETYAAQAEAKATT